MGSRSPRQGKAALSKLPLVAIIDDDASVLATTDSLVRSLGYIVNTFASAEEFLRSNRLDDLSCVIADVQMPGMSGVELQDRLIADGRSLPTVFISAFSDERVQQKVLESGAVGYLHKPFEEDRLIECIETALKGQGAET